MDLKTYLNDLPVGGKTRFAEQLDVSPAYLYQMASGIRPVSAVRAIQIEQVTNGGIRCEDLRPDIDWSVLRQSSPEPKEAA